MPVEWVGPTITGVFTIFVALIEWTAARDRKRLKEQAQKVQEEARKNTALVDGVQALLRNEIIAKYNHYTDKGHIPIYGMENVLDMFNAYRALGGNGTAAKLVDAMKDLPTDLPQ